MPPVRLVAALAPASLGLAAEVGEGDAILGAALGVVAKSGPASHLRTGLLAGEAGYEGRKG